MSSAQSVHNEFQASELNVQSFQSVAVLKDNIP